MTNRISALISWLALPIYIWQGLSVRRKTIRMAPPPGPARQEISGEGDPIRVLVIGDSSAAGVGVDNLEDSLGGNLIRLLSEKSGKPAAIGALISVKHLVPW